MAFLAPLLLVGLSALAIPVLIHLVQRERKQVIPFPSLMFVRRIPYQSIRRRRIRNWLLLAMRAAALLLIVLAFARPFFRRGPIASAAAASGGREVVILLDRSASMAYGDHWSNARAAARRVVDALGSADRATLVVFASGAEESVRATDNHARLAAAIDATRPGSGATRYGPALKLAMSVLAKSTLPRREAVLISDFQRSGWRGSEDVRFPDGTLLTPVSVASAGVQNLSVPSVSLARAPFSGKERITVTAAVRNNAAAAANNVPVSLQIGDNVIETLSTTVAANASASVSFAPFTLATPGMTALVRAGTDALPADNTFRFVLAPSPTVSVLVVEPESAGTGSSLYLTRALSIGTAPQFAVDVLAANRMSKAALDSHGVVILNGVPAARVGSAALAQFVERGGGLVMVLGTDAIGAGVNVSDPSDDVLPAPIADRDDAASPHVTTVGFVDYSHPVFEIFQGPHGGDFSGARVFRYRTLQPRRNDRVLARFSDGAVAMLERHLGTGRVVAWSSTFDDSWNDLALKPVFLPLVQQIARYVARYQQQPAWQTVGQALDLEDADGPKLAAPSSSSTVSPQAGATLVLTPSGQRLEHGADGKRLRFIELEEQGFYELRSAAAAAPRGTAQPHRIAVNLDPAESDLSTVDPQELVAAVTGHAQQTAANVGPTPLTTEELERRQSIWRYLLFAALLLLAAETVVSNRLSEAALAKTALGTKHSRTPIYDTRKAPREAVLEGRVDVAR